MPQYQIETMKPDDITLAVRWAMDEGWNPGLNDGPCFYRTDPDGFFVGKLDGEPIACISAISYGKDFGFIGFYIVHPDYRGNGYGYQIWQKAIDYLSDHQSIGLDGVIDQQSNYQKSGFKLAYSNIRFEGRIAGKDSPNIVPIVNVPSDAVRVYDRLCFPTNRNTFLECWFNMGNGITLAKWEANTLRGYGTIRSCFDGYKIGPLFADTANIAEEILLALCVNIQGEPFYLDVPEINSAGMALAEKYDMKKVFGTARMYKGTKPDFAINKIFGVTTFELG